MNRSKKCVMKVPVITSIIMILFLIAAGYVFASEPSGSENKTIGEAAEGQSLSTPLEGLAEDVKYDFTNTRESQKNNPARQIAITKQLAGEDITESDRSLEFTFNIRVTGLDPSLTYRVVRPQDNEADLPQEAYRSAPGGVLDVTERLKDGETLYVKDIPEGKSFTVSEKMRSVNNEFDFDARYEVTQGEDTVTRTGKAASKTAQELSSPEETMGNENIEFTFINSKARPHDLEFVKEVILDGEKQTDEMSFPFTLTFRGLDPNTTYISKDGAVNIVTDEAGFAKLETELSTTKALIFENVPGTTVYEIEESVVSYVPNIIVREMSSGEELDSADGQWGEGIVYTSSEKGLSADQSVAIVNSKNKYNDLSITKAVDGSGADSSDVFTITVKFRGLAKNTTYTVAGDGMASGTMISDQFGKASKALIVSGGTRYTFKDIPDTAEFTLTESAAAGYLPSFSVETDGGIEAIARGGKKGEVLSLPGWEKLVTDTTYKFLNWKDLEGPVKTVSDMDDVTLTGSGAETDVAENTVENRSSRWKYKITQDVPAGSESFTLTDTLPPYIMTELSADPDYNMVHAKLVRGNTVIEGNYAKSGNQFSNDAFAITIDDSDVKAVLTLSMKEAMLAEGGRVELEFEAYLPADVTIDDLKKVNCVGVGGKRLIFKNEAVTFVGGWKFNSEAVTTNVLLDNGLTIKKFVPGTLGDRDKAFDFNIALSGLTEGVTYSYSCDGENSYFTARRDGTASVDFSLSHDQSIAFDDLPSGAEYNITEKESDYKASYIVSKGAAYTNNSYKTNPEAEMELKTGANIYHADKDVSFVFSNRVQTKGVIISKKAAGFGEELPGANMRLTTAEDADTEIDQWISDWTPHEIELAAGREYILHEDEAPLGYDFAENITFRLVTNESDGVTVQVKDGEMWKAVEDSTVVMYDEPDGTEIDRSHHINPTGVPKVGFTLGGAIAAALLAILFLYLRRQENR